jgi:hypothetical protein
VSLIARLPIGALEIRLISQVNQFDKRKSCKIGVDAFLYSACFMAFYSPDTMMRPRIVFATLLAIAAALHIAQLGSPRRGLAPLVIYFGWLLFSAAVIALLRPRPSAHQTASVPKRRMHQAHGIEGLSWFVGTVSIGLMVHLLNASISSSRWPAGRGIFLLVAVCAGGFWLQLRGLPGDLTAPIPDGSRLVRAGAWLRRSVGIVLGCLGTWLLVFGIRHWGLSDDGLNRLLNLMFVVSGPALVLIGLALTLPRNRGA